MSYYPDPVPPPPYAVAQPPHTPSPPPQRHHAFYVPQPQSQHHSFGPAPLGSPYPQIPHHHHSFGPTPISAQPITSYAYYDPRSPHSIAQAAVRARQRFFEALFWAIAIWCMIGFFIGSSAVTISMASR